MRFGKRWAGSARVSSDVRKALEEYRAEMYRVLPKIAEKVRRREVAAAHLRFTPTTMLKPLGGDRFAVVLASEAGDDAEPFDPYDNA